VIIKNSQRIPTDCEICILAGGLSTRMGRDKGSIKLGRKTMLGRVRAAARATGLDVRVIRKDLVPRCGPLGGVYTALKTTRAEAVLFLACDMPFVTVALLKDVLESRAKRSSGSVFVVCDGRAGFPFVIPKMDLVLVENQMVKKAFSIHALASVLIARRLRLGETWRLQLTNINTPGDWEALQDL
jgi:molybdopterin-guanine dinucleotide biosynthesis protein A